MFVPDVGQCFARYRFSSANEKFDTTNPPKGDNQRVGAVRDRSQTLNPRNDRWTKRDAGTGKFLDQKADKAPFKGVRREHPKGR
jgi:hypothetical protein